MKKLVRDRIPELSGKRVEKVKGNELLQYLHMKLREESTELLEATFFDDPISSKKIKEELGDVVTVVISIANAHGFCWEEIEEEIKRKGKEKGGFGAGYVMEVE